MKIMLLSAETFVLMYNIIFIDEKLRISEKNLKTLIFF